MQIRSLLPLIFAAGALTACVTNPSSGESANASPTAASTSQKADSSAKGGVKPGMDAKGNVIDPTKVESGSGRTVKGINDYEGEITGNPVPGSKFDKLKIGMSMKQVQDIVGPPTDQGAYMTGKAWIPFYFGGDTYRHELTYKGKGRLIFAGGSMSDLGGGHLVWIIHSANESGYR